jgi:ribose 5-phosphate isomerase A
MHRRIDLTIDGADQVERGTLTLVKGMGGALLREKIVASASQRMIVVVDEAKRVERLGGRTPLPEMHYLTGGKGDSRMAFKVQGDPVQIAIDQGEVVLERLILRRALPAAAPM